MDKQSGERTSAIINAIMGTVSCPLIVTDLHGRILRKNKATDDLVKKFGKEKLLGIFEQESAKLASDKNDSTASIVIHSQANFPELNLTVNRALGHDFLVWSVDTKESLDRLDLNSEAHAERLMSIGQMAAGLVHEIRNPLTIISGQVSLVKSKMEKGEITIEFAHKLVERVEKSSGRINRIIRSVLNLSAKGNQSEKKAIPITEIVEEIQLFGEINTKGKKIEFSILRPEDDFTVLCHHAELMQVIVNLIRNAKEEHEGRNAEQRPWIKVSLEKSSNEFICKVTDSGNGIPDDIAAQIFNPFFTTKAVGQGTGLGLALCQTLVEENLGGQLYLDKDCPNTQFILKIPL